MAVPARPERAAVPAVRLPKGCNGVTAAIPFEGPAVGTRDNWRSERDAYVHEHASGSVPRTERNPPKSVGWPLKTMSMTVDCCLCFGLIWLNNTAKNLK